METERDPFEECVSLDHSVVFLIPSTDNVSEVDLGLQAEVLAYISEQLAVTYGGVTVEPTCDGGWPSQTAGLVWEKVVPVKCYLGDLSVTTKRHLITLAKHVKATMHQEAVLFVVDGVGKLV